MIRRLTLQNWRAYEHLDLHFDPGATFVVAPNGVGKSSIVEGARYALFGSVPPNKHGASRIVPKGPTSATVEVVLPSGGVLTVTRAYPTGSRATTPNVRVDDEPHPAENLGGLLAAEFGAEPAFLARLAMLHSSTVFSEAKGLDLREHLSRVFGVDGIVAALEQTKALTQAAKKTIDSARRVTAVSDDELAALIELEARATELTEAADVERVEAERALAAAREATASHARHTEWRAASARYVTACAEIAAAATALLGRDMNPQILAADLPNAEASALDTLDALRRQRAEIAGRLQAIRGGLADLERATGTCPVCRRPLDAADVEAARASHEAEVASLEAALASLSENGAAHVVDGLRELRSRLADEPQPGPEPPALDDDPTMSEPDALERFDLAVETAAERRAILTEAQRRRAECESVQDELAAVTAAFERAATLEATAAALEAARRRLLDESIEPLEDLLAENWRKLFVDRPGIGLQGDGTLRRRIGTEDLDYEQFSDGEKMVAQLVLRVLVLRATTRLGFFWIDEPLEHLDPDARRALAVLLARAPESPSFPQVLVTTYEEPLIRRLGRAIPNTHLLYVRPAVTEPLPASV
jgi:DNA repair exonuclease SbcCD ATPase subunit